MAAVVSRLSLLPLLVALAFSGCFGFPGKGTNEGLPVVQPTVLSFEKAIVLDPDRQGFEPTMAISSVTGTILVCSPIGVGHGNRLWRSDDGGKTFHFVGTSLPLPLFPFVTRSKNGDVGDGGDCNPGVDAGGRFYLASGVPVGVSVSWSEDDGLTWVSNRVASPVTLSDRPWTLGGEPGEVFVTFGSYQPSNTENYGIEEVPVSGVWVIRSTDGGLTFPQQVLAIENIEGRFSLNSNLAMGDGRLYLLYTQKTDTKGLMEVRVAVSEDRGQTWNHQVIGVQPYYPGQCFSPLSIFPVIAADPRGGVYATWVLANPDTNRYDLFYAASPDAGRTWNPPVLVTNREGTRDIPWVSTSPSGQVSLVWYETNVTLPPSVAREPVSGVRDGCLTEDLEDGTDAPQTSWYFHYAQAHNGLMLEPSFQDILVQPEPITVTEGYLSQPYGEIAQVVNDGARVAVVYTSDLPNAPPSRPLFAWLAAPGAGKL